MEKITDWTQVAWKSLVTLSESIMQELPSIIGAIFLLILGWIIAKVLYFIVRKALRLMGLDKLAEKESVSKYLVKARITAKPSKLVGKAAYWVIMLLFFVIASDTLGWTIVSQSMSDLLAYLPKLFSAIVIFIIGLYIANFVKQALRGIFDSLNIASGNVVSSFAFYLIVVLLTLTALRQAGVETQIITSNVTVIIGGIILAFAVSFGLGSRDILKNILSSFYSKNIFEVGQKIEVNGVSGTIEKIDNTSCIITTSSGKVVIPVSQLLSETVTVN